MMREEQAISMAEQQIQQDFPGLELGPMLRASYENHCWYLFFRLRQGQDTLDVLYGVYRSPGKSFVATLFDTIPHETGLDAEALEGRAEWIIFQLRRMMKDVLRAEKTVTRYEDLERASTSAITAALEIIAEFAPQSVQDEVQKLVHGCYRALLRSSLGIQPR